MLPAKTRTWFWLLLAALVVLHQDYWQQDNADLLLGFMPRGLAWHVALSILAAAFWLWVVNFCWPENLDVAADPSAEQEPAP